MIQDKIDRIGDFRFRLRGWIVTLVTVVATAAFSAKLTSLVFLLGVIAICGFQRMEILQSRWEHALINRAAILEGELQPLFGAPGTVSMFRLARNAARQRALTSFSDSQIFYGLMYLVAIYGFATTTDWHCTFQMIQRGIAWVAAQPAAYLAN